MINVKLGYEIAKVCYNHGCKRDEIEETVRVALQLDGSLVTYDMVNAIRKVARNYKRGFIANESQAITDLEEQIAIMSM